MDISQTLWDYAQDLRERAKKRPNLRLTLRGIASHVDTLAQQVFGSQHSLHVVQDLSCGAALTMHLHPWQEHTWVFAHTFHQENPETFETTILCEWKCVVHYTDGLLQPDVEVSMHIIIPSRLGKEFAWGIDISPGAKTFLIFKYRWHEPSRTFRLASFQVGAREQPLPESFWAPDGDKTLMKPIGFPFPLTDCIRQEHYEPDGLHHEDTPQGFGDFQVPFPVLSEETGTMEVRQIFFPPSLRQGGQT